MTRDESQVEEEKPAREEGREGRPDLVPNRGELRVAITRKEKLAITQANINDYLKAFEVALRTGVTLKLEWDLK